MSKTIWKDTEKTVKVAFHHPPPLPLHFKSLSPFSRYHVIKMIIFDFNFIYLMIIWHLIVSPLSIEALIYPLGFRRAYYSCSYV